MGEFIVGSPFLFWYSNLDTLNLVNLTHMTEELTGNPRIPFESDTVLQVWNTVDKVVIGVYENGKAAAIKLSATYQSVVHSYSRKRVVKGKIKSDHFTSPLYPDIPLAARLIRRTTDMLFRNGVLYNSLNNAA